MPAGAASAAAVDTTVTTPEFGKTFVVRAVAGDVLTCSAPPEPECTWLIPGQRRAMPLGSIVNTHGRDSGTATARIVVAEDPRGHLNWADVSRGEVEVTQVINETAGRVIFTRLRMIDGDFSDCSPATASRKKKDPDRPRRILSVRKHGPIISDSDRSKGQTSGDGTAWIVRDFCDYSEIEAVDGIVRNATTEVSANFQAMRPGDRAKQACGRPPLEVTAATQVRAFCLLLYKWTTASLSPRQGLKMPPLGSPAFSFRPAVLWRGRPTPVVLCRRFPEFAETCQPLSLQTRRTGLRHYVGRVRYFCLPNRAGTYVFRMKVAGVQIGPRLQFDFSGLAPEFPSLACLPHGRPSAL